MFRRSLALAALAAAIALPSVALAGKKDTSTTSSQPEIQLLGVDAFDGVLGSAKGIQDKIKTQTTNMSTARANVNSALGVATDAPFKTAVDDLKAKAGDKISVAMDGTMPKLKASDAAPENVTKGIDAVNGLVDAGKSTIDTCIALKTEITGLISQAQAFPAQLPSVLKSNPLDIPKKTKILTDDIKIMGDTPQMLDDMVKEAEGIFNDVKAVFGG
ncbi:MAG: hypothetical protein FJ102_10725 [Deltaproteobacteria bacterium]|nr:hypothetical protein [Deltaproteobacteria bacterium]